MAGVSLHNAFPLKHLTDLRICPIVKLADFGVSGQLSATMTKKVRQGRVQLTRGLAKAFVLRIRSLGHHIGWYV